MSLKAGRVGVNPSQVDPVDGSILSSSTSGYTKQEADAKFLTQSDAASTYESKSDANTAYAALQPKTLAVPISMLGGTKLTVENALQGLNTEKFTYADNGVLGAKNRLALDDVFNGGELATITDNGRVIEVKSAAAGTWLQFQVYVNVEENTDYIITSDIDYTSGKGRIAVSNEANTSTIAQTEAVTSDKSVSLNFNSGNNRAIIVKFACVLADSEVGDVVYNNTMLRLAADTDGTYQPYAMTNKEITEFKIKLETDLLMASSFSDFQQRMSS